MAWVFVIPCTQLRVSRSGRLPYGSSTWQGHATFLTGLTLGEHNGEGLACAPGNPLPSLGGLARRTANSKSRQNGREPGAEVPQDFVPSGYVVPPLRAHKGSQVCWHHTPRNDEDVALELPQPEGWAPLPFQAPSLPRKLSGIHPGQIGNRFTNNKSAPDGTSPCPFR